MLRVPFAQPDELIYSVAARFSEINRYVAPHYISESLFGAGHAIATIEFPSRLAHYLNRLSDHDPRYGEKAQIEGHTMYPWYAPFMAAERAERLWRIMVDGTGEGLQTMAGIIAGGVPNPKHLRYCPACLQEDVDSVPYVEPERRKFIFMEPVMYWRRLHQLAGVEVCPKHGLMLEDSSAVRGHGAKRLKFISPGRASVDLQAKRPSTQPILREVSKMAEQVLNNSWQLPEGGSFKESYLKLFTERGLTQPNGQVQWAAVADQVKAAFPEDYLSRINSPLHSRPEKSWIHHMIHKPENAHAPIRHLVLLIALGAGLEDLFAKPVEVETRMAQCRNPLCAQPMVAARSCKHSRDWNGQVAEYRCPTCSRIWLRGLESGRERVTEYGDVWNQRLWEMWHDPKASLRKMSRIFGVDCVTVKRQAKKLGLPLPRTVGARVIGDGQIHEKKDRSEQIAAWRKEWLKLVGTHPHTGVTALKKQNATLYFRLYRADRQWLKENSPRAPKAQRPGTNWETLDAFSAHFLRQSLEGSDDGFKERRRSRTSLIARIGDEYRDRYRKHPQRFPMTTEVIDDFEESREAFACRRIQAVLSDEQRFSEQGGGHVYMVPRRWDVCRKAGLRPEVQKMPAVAALLDTESD